MAKFCVHCGNEVYEEAIVCIKCGCSIPQTPHGKEKKRNAVKFCSYCGSAVNEGAFICIQCGCAVINVEEQKDLMEKDIETPHFDSSKNEDIVIKTVASDTKVSLGWYKFLIYFLLFLGAIINFINGICYLSGNIYSLLSSGKVTAEDVYRIYGNGLHSVDVFFGLFSITFAIFALVTRDQLAKFKPNAPKYVTAYYAISAGATFLNSVLVMSITSAAMDVSQIVSIITSVIFLFLNMKYFEARTNLFNGENHLAAKATLRQQYFNRFDDKVEKLDERTAQKCRCQLCDKETEHLTDCKIIDHLGTRYRSVCDVCLHELQEKMQK